MSPPHRDNFLTEAAARTTVISRDGYAFCGMVQIDEEDVDKFIEQIMINEFIEQINDANGRLKAAQDKLISSPRHLRPRTKVLGKSDRNCIRLRKSRKEIQPVVDKIDAEVMALQGELAAARDGTYDRDIIVARMKALKAKKAVDKEQKKFEEEQAALAEVFQTPA